MQQHNRHKFFLKWLLALPFIFFYQVTIGNAVFGGIDILKQHIPMKFYNAISFKAGNFPLWNPWIFQGFPHFAEGQSGPLYIGNILLYLSPVGWFVHAYDYTVILHFVLGSWLCYIFFRRKGLTPLASFFGSISFLFCPFILIHASAPSLHQVVVFFPLMLMIYDSAMKRPFINCIWGALLTSVILFAGHVQMVFYTFIALGMYAIFVGILDAPPGENYLRLKRSLVFYLVSAILGVGIAAIQILPTLELSALTERGADSGIEFYSIGTWLSLPRLASIFVIPALDRAGEFNHYGTSVIYYGVFPVLMFLFAWRDSDFRRKAIPWLICFVIMYLFAMGMNNPLNQLLVKIPPFSLFRYLGRQSIFAGFFLAYPFALAIQVVISKGRELLLDGGVWQNVWRECLFILALLLVMTMLSTLGTFYLVGLAHFVLQMAIALVFITLAIKRFSTDYIKVGLLIHLLMFLGMAFLLSNTTQIYRTAHEESFEAYGIISTHPYKNKSTFIASDRLFISPKDVNNFLLTPQKHITYDASGSAGIFKWGIPNTNAYTPLKTSEREILHKYITLELTSGSVDEEDLPFLEYLLYDILGTNFLIVTGKNWNFSKYFLDESLVDHPLSKGFDDTTYLYFAKKEHPGFYLRENGSEEEIPYSLSANLVENYKKQFLQMTYEKSLYSYRKWLTRHLAMIETPDSIYLSKMLRPKNPSFPEYEFRWDGLFERMLVKDPKDYYDGILLHESFFPGWTALVNGEQVQIDRADKLFKYIPLGPGTEYDIELQYFPESFRKGLFVSLVSAWIWITLFAIAVWQRKKNKPEIDEE